MFTNRVRLAVPEKKRTYFFPNKESVTLYNVSEIIITESGNHRIKTLDNKLHIIPCTWLHIEIITEPSTWSF